MPREQIHKAPGCAPWLKGPDLFRNRVRLGLCERLPRRVPYASEAPLALRPVPNRVFVVALPGSLVGLGHGMAEFLQKGKDLAVEKGKEVYRKEFLRADVDVEYSAIEDFTRMDPDLKRMVVIGCTGAGKSTLLNVMAGNKFEQSEETDFEFKWEKEPLFASEAGTSSVTKNTSFANLRWFGEAGRQFVAIDTPGHDDPGGSDLDDEKGRLILAEMAADLHNKLKATDHVNAILVLHNDVASNRLNPATYQILKMIDEKFKETTGADDEPISVWDHVIVAYSKCNHHDSYWLSGLKKKKETLQEEIKKKIPNCKTDVKVIALGGGDLVGVPDRPPMTSADFEVLWQFLQDAPPLDTSSLKVFEGEWSKYEKAIKEKDEAIALAEAYKAYSRISAIFMAIFGFFFFRAMMLPRFLGFLLLNYPGPHDEILLSLLAAYVLGPNKVMLSANIVYKKWWQEWIGPMLMGRLHDLKQKHTQ